MEKVYLALGGNLGNVNDIFNKAIKEIENNIGTIISKSSRYETAPWGNKSQDNFLNQVILVESNQAPQSILQKLLELENKMGRFRNINDQNAPRTLDIDILFYGNKIINEGNLVIPHPRLHLRNFVLIPLLEIIPDFIHPLLKKSIRELLVENKDNLSVKKIEEPGKN